MQMRISKVAACLLGVLLVAQTAVAQSDTGPLVHLTFDGTLTPVAGRDLGLPQAFNDPQFVEGRHGEAISLTDGAHLLLKLPPSIGKKGEYTLAFWMKPRWHPKDNLPHPIMEIPARPETYDKVKWSTGQMLFSKGWSETISPNHVYGVVDSGIALLHLKPGRWTHVVLTYSLPAKVQANYLDGEGRRRPIDPKKPLHFHADQLWVGCRADGKGTADVILDDLRIYDRAIDPSEIPAIAGATFPPPVDYSLLGTQVDPSRAVETPHRTWAKPYAGGKTRVLFVSEGVRAREIFELAQRVEIEPAVVTGPMLHKHSLANPETFHAMGSKIEVILAERDIDCVILASFGWNLFEDATRQAILDFVRDGGGLLLVPPRCLSIQPGQGIHTNTGRYWIGWEATPLGKEVNAHVGRLPRDDEEYLTAGIPWHELSMFQVHTDRQSPASLFRGGRLGDGRILLYFLHSCASTRASLTPGIAYVQPLDTFDYEYALGAAARAVLWASGRDGAIRIQRVEFRSRHFFRKIPVGHRGAWELDLSNGTHDNVRARIELTARTRDGDAPFIATRNVTLKPGRTRLTMDYTIDRFGTIFADARLVIAEKVADWASGTVRVHHGNPYFQSLTSDRDVYENGQTPRASVDVIYKDYGVKDLPPGLVRWRVIDAYGRVVSRGEETVPFNPHDALPARHSWSLPALDRASLSYTLVADLFDHRGRLGDQGKLVLRCRRVGVDDFTFFSWGGGHTVTGSLATVLMRDRYGLESVGTQITGEPVNERFLKSLEWTGSLNLRPWVHATALGGTVDENYVRKPDLSDAALFAQHAEKLKNVARAAEPYSPLYYSLGDETKLGPLDAHPTGHEQEAFRAWLKNRHTKVEQLNAAWGTEYEAWPDVVIPSGDAMKSGKANLKLRAELGVFRNRQLANVIGGCVDAIREVAPHAKVGIEGIFGLTHAWGAFDYWPVTRRSTFMGQYALGRELDMVRSFQKPGDLLGCWYNYATLDREYSLYGPWHTLLRGLHAFGWYTTFEGSKYTALNPDFTPFEHFAWTYEELEPILGGIGKLVLGLDRDDPGIFILHEHRNLHRTSPQYHGLLVMTTLLEDLGLQCNYLAGQQIVDGALKQPGVNALVLAGQWVMEKPVAEAIREFVKEGGTVVTDILPGISDGLNRYDKRLLDDIFAEPGKTQRGALHERTVGKGRTLTFGGYAPSYLRERLKPAGAVLRQAVARFLDSRSIRPAFTARPADGTFLPITVVCFRDGDCQYVGLQRDYKIADQSPKDFDVIGSTEAHVYDVRAGEYLGRARRVRRGLEVARGALLAFLPYHATRLEIRGLPAACCQGDLIRLQAALHTEGERPSNGIVRVEVRDPAGKRSPMLSHKILSRAGLAEWHLRIALNDPVGNWTILATDIATGTSATKQFRLIPR